MSKAKQWVTLADWQRPLERKGYAYWYTHLSQWEWEYKWPMSRTQYYQ